MTGGCVDRLRVPRCRPVASAVVRRAQVRAAFDDLLWNLDVGGSGVVAAILAPAARVLRDAAGLRRIRFVPRRVPVGRPLPDVADHVVQTVTVRRECGDRRRALEPIGIGVLAGEFTLPGIGHVTAMRRELIAPRELGAEFAWGDEFTPHGRHMANTWQGEFPRQNANADGFERTSPVTAFPPNGYGLYDMIGNVWEWTADWYSPRHEADAPKACCIPQNPRGGREDGSYDPRTTNVKIPQKVIKGGSHLCAPNYCRRYRPAARHAEPVDTSTSHLGFRCIRRGASDAS